MRILEPEHPKRSELWRKIALSHHCSLYLEIVDPLLPFNKPQIRLFGSESRVENLRRVWDQAEWNKSLPLHTNLLTIFQLVPNDKQEQEDYTNASDIECAICYSYKLENGETPETICKLCNRGFHSTCLYQWLRSNPNTTQSFNWTILLIIPNRKLRLKPLYNGIIIRRRDMSDREHELKVILPSNYPFTAPHIIADTPVPIQSSLSLTTIVRQHQTIIDQSSLSLTTIVRQHQTIIGQHQDLFNCLDDLDRHMRILEPEHPKRSELWRKIALSHHCSLYLEIVDPLLPFNKPQIRLFGSESRVENLRRVWDQAKWNKSLPLHTNLLTIFQLVPNDKQEQEDYTNASDIECAICYSYKLENGETPETICKLCNRGFHSTCLYQHCLTPLIPLVASFES
ncbi:hypothetical protein RMCBS344292_11961 [Rhizopus microsporus]|nr:hypothetical protein RMCBS344292_11961 [Rhizopus microsporus]